MMILREHVEIDHLDLPPVVLTVDFMHAMMSKNVFEKIKFNDHDKAVSRLTQAERNYFIYSMFNGVMVDSDLLMNIFISIPSLSISKIRKLHNLFFENKCAIKKHILRSFKMPFESAANIFRIEYEEMEYLKGCRKSLVKNLKIEYGLVYLIDTDSCLFDSKFNGLPEKENSYFHKKVGNPKYLSDHSFDGEINKLDIVITPFLEEFLFDKNIDREDKVLLWSLAINSFSMNEEQKIEFLLSLSCMDEGAINQWIKELLCGEYVLGCAIFDRLVDEGGYYMAITKFENFYKQYQDIEKYIADIPSKLEAALKVGDEFPCV